MNALERYATARATAKRHQTEIADIGRAIHKLRTGHELHYEFRFCGFHKSLGDDLFSYDFNGQDGDGYRTPCYPEGTPLIVVSYDHARWGQGREVAIPATYFDDGFDYLVAEQAALVATEVRLEDQTNKAAAEAEAARQRHDRETYERLRARFEGDAR